MKEKLASWIATCGPFGRIPFAPGTFGSLFALPFVWFFSGSTSSLIFLFIVSLIIGIWSSDVVSKQKGVHDPSYVVIDEFCGIVTTFLFLPMTITTLIIGFVLFRIFDILKPPPIRLLEQFPGGIGIVADDIGAGIFANVILQVIVHYASL